MRNGVSPLRGKPALASVQHMATTLASVEAREVLRCGHCQLVQFRTINALCRRCHKSLEMEEPEPVMPAATSATREPEAEEGGLQVARAVRDARRGRNLSQRQLAGRMQVPRTYISKIANGKAMPTLSSLERLATALEVDMCNLLHDARNRQHDESLSILDDPFLSEIAPLISKLDAPPRSMVLNQLRAMAMGRRRTAVA
jgi:transcriptional regulator with XRE-family HTH domain